MSHFNLVFVTSLQDALSALDNSIDLIMCNVQFGDSELYDFLRATKLHPRARHLPFLVITGQMDAFSPAILQSIEIATKASGADQFVDLARWRKELGDAKAFEKVAAVIHHHLSS